MTMQKDAPKISLPTSPFLKTSRPDPFLEFLKKKKIDFILEENVEKSNYIFLYPNLLSEMYKICRKYKNKVLIFLTSEAVTPDFNLFDYAFGYDRLIFGDRYVQVPYQMHFFDYDLEQPFNNELNILNENKRFCNFIYSNPNAHQNSDLFFRKLCAYKKVDSLGSHLNNVTQNISDRHSIDFFTRSVIEKQKYKFSIAFENAFHAGYNTEKIISSFLAGTIPIYWGDKEITRFYNSKSFINCHDYNSFDEVIEKVKELDKDTYQYNEILTQKKRTTEQINFVEQLNKDFVKQLNFIFSQPYEIAFRKPVGTFNDFYLNSKTSYFFNLKKNWKKIHHQAYLIKERLKV